MAANCANKHADYVNLQELMKQGKEHGKPSTKTRMYLGTDTSVIFFGPFYYELLCLQVQI